MSRARGSQKSKDKAPAPPAAQASLPDAAPPAAQAEAAPIAPIAADPYQGSGGAPANAAPAEPSPAETKPPVEKPPKPEKAAARKAAPAVEKPARVSLDELRKAGHVAAERPAGAGTRVLTHGGVKLTFPGDEERAATLTQKELTGIDPAIDPSKHKNVTALSQ